MQYQLRRRPTRIIHATAPSAVRIPKSHQLPTSTHSVQSRSPRSTISLGRVRSPHKYTNEASFAIVSAFCIACCWSSGYAQKAYDSHTSRPSPYQPMFHFTHKKTRLSNDHENQQNTLSRTLEGICRFDLDRVAKATLKKRQHIGPRCLVLNSYPEHIRKICRLPAGINISGATQTFSQDGTKGKRFTTNSRKKHRNNYPTISQFVEHRCYMTRHTTNTQKHLSRGWNVKKHNAESWTNKKKSKPQLASCGSTSSRHTCAGEAKHMRRRNSPPTN